MVKKSFKAVELKYLDKETTEQIRIWRNSEFIRKQSFTNHIITPEEHKNFINKIKNDNNRGLFVFYLDDEPFGVYQYEINHLNNFVTIGNYLIDEEYQYMGYGAIMLYFILEINFRILNIHKQYGEVLDTNVKSLSIYKKLNSIEGHFREHIKINESYHDLYTIGILEKDYKYIKTKLKNIINTIVKEEPIEHIVLL